MKLYDIISNLKFLGIKNYKEMDIDALTCSSKEHVNNGIYFCLKGGSVDGHTFANESISNGAVCLVVEKFLDVDATQILVEDARVAMSYISSIFYQTYKSKMKFIGITGTNGKTTSTFIIKDILSKMGKRVGLIGTEGVYINKLLLPATLTTPDPIVLHKLISDMENNACEYCVMEVSAHSIALNKIDDINYDVVGLTNITKDHLDFFINMENYVKCKLSLFDYRHAKMGVVCDNKYLKEVKKQANIDLTTIGKDGNFKIIDIDNRKNGTDVKFIHNETEYELSTNLIGTYNIQNLFMAMACLNNLGFEIGDIIKIIEKTEFVVPGRLNLLNIPADYNVIVDYAHTPDGINNVIKALKQLKTNRIITVFGCGGNRDKTKRSEMGKIACDLSDMVVITSDNPRYENPQLIIDDITRGLENKNYTTIVDRKQAIEYALNLAKAGDIVAILGKGNESYQEIKGVKFHFSDYEVVDNYFKNILKEEDII